MHDVFMYICIKINIQPPIAFKHTVAEAMAEPTQAVHSNLFAQLEPSWRPLLQRPKKRKQSCVPWRPVISGGGGGGDLVVLDLVVMVRPGD